jgi:putative Holliday junction resolvase
MAGQNAGITTAALRFADRLGEQYGIEVYRVDERLSSHEAEDELRERRRSGSKPRRVRRGDVDREAARILLLQWLRAQPGEPAR